MASHHQHHNHHHHHHNPPPPLSTATTTTTTCYCQNNSLDQLLQLLSSQLLLQQQQSDSCSCHHQKRHRFQQQIPNDSQHLLSSLSQRISDLESSLHNFNKTRSRQILLSTSLRDAAARVIQTHFRSFLARRSMTLRQLKELGFIKSSFTSLKHAVSNNARFDFDVVSNKAMEFLLKLDSIQGTDTMIRDGKRSITRDLVRFLDFIDEVSIQRRRKSPKSVMLVEKVRVLNGGGRGNLGRHHNQREIVEKLRDKAEKIHGISRRREIDEEDQQFIPTGQEDLGICPTVAENKINRNRNGVLLQRVVGHPRVKKSVSFAENGNLYKVFGEAGESGSSGYGSVSDGSESGDEQGELIENHFVTRDEHVEPLLEGADEKSNGERKLRGRVRNDHEPEINLQCHDQDGNLVFSAPLAMKMEPKITEML